MSTSPSWTNQNWNAVTITDQRNGRHTHHGDRIVRPLTWPRQTTTLVASSAADLFHEAVPDEFIAQVMAVVAMTPQHTYHVLTRHPARMNALLHDFAFRVQLCAAIEALTTRYRSKLTDAEIAHAKTAPSKWPMPNLWLGVEIEDQDNADQRIPDLIASPAAVRYVVADPLLSAVDLTPWLPPTVPITADQAPATWSDWKWPAWVPYQVRVGVEDYWLVGEDGSGGPRAWLRDAADNNSHAFGLELPDHEPGTRWVHARGTLGRLVLDGGRHTYSSFTPADVQAARPLDWIIVGGDTSGDPQRLDPKWAAALQAQARAAGATFYFTRPGTVLAHEWGTTGDDPDEWRVPFSRDYPDAPAAGFPALDPDLIEQPADDDTASIVRVAG